MRLWTLHPCYLDPKGLVAAWREALLAQKVISGATRGYRNHPQLQRFRTAADPSAAIASFLWALATEATHRGYHFDTSKITGHATTRQLCETRGQLDYEWEHLTRKLKVRSPAWALQWQGLNAPEAHPLFRIVAGGIRHWEKTPTKPAEVQPRRQSRVRAEVSG